MNLLVNILTPIAPILTRLIVGSAFIAAGYGKLQNLERTTQFFTNLGIPAPGIQAPFIAGLEFAGGIALIVGFGTRIFSALLAATMTVAIATAHREEFINAVKFSGDKTPIDVTPVYYLLPLGWLIVAGAGAMSIDRLLSSRSANSNTKA
ncbi:MAG: DoxX family protein [Planctomycetota bacterium]